MVLSNEINAWIVDGVTVLTVGINIHFFVIFCVDL